MIQLINFIFADIWHFVLCMLGVEIVGTIIGLLLRIIVYCILKLTNNL